MWTRCKPFYTEQEAMAAFRQEVEADAEVDPQTVHYDWNQTLQSNSRCDSVLLTPRIVSGCNDPLTRFSGLVALVSQRLWRHSVTKAPRWTSLVAALVALCLCGS